MSLSGYTDDQLRSELRAREKKRARELHEAINREYGPCEHCGREVAFIQQTVHEQFVTGKTPEARHKAAAGLTLDPFEEEWIVVSWRVLLRCANGHEWERIKVAR